MNHYHIFSYKLWIFLTTVTLLFFGCKKQERILIFDGHIDPKAVEKIYAEKKFSDHLSTTFNDSLNAVWSPDWAAITYKTEKDQNEEVQYAYVPLRPSLKLKNGQRIFKVKEFNQAKFLIARAHKDSLSLFLARYVTFNQSFIPGVMDFNEKIFFPKFSGIVLLDNFEGVTTHNSYINGKRHIEGSKTRSIILNGGGERAVLARTESEDQPCVTTCEWGMYCAFGQEQEGFHIYSTEEYGTECRFPPTPPCSSMWSHTTNAAPSGMQLLQSTTRCSNPEFTPITVTPVKDPFGFPLPGGGGTPSGGDGDTDIKPLPVGNVDINHTADIKSDLKNKCLIKALDMVKNKDLKNWVSTTINSMFGEKTNYDLIFREKPNSQMTVEEGIVAMGQLNLQDTHLNSSNVNGVAYTGGELFIDLNIDELPKASYEYIATTIMHEAIHGYLYMKGIQYISINNQQHERMAAIYTEKMSIALHEMFPQMSEKERNSIVWAGLRGTLVSIARDLRDMLKNPVFNNPEAQTAKQAYNTLIDYQEGRIGTISECL